MSDAALEMLLKNSGWIVSADPLLAEKAKLLRTTLALDLDDELRALTREDGFFALPKHWQDFDIPEDVDAIVVAFSTNKYASEKLVLVCQVTNAAYRAAKEIKVFLTPVTN